MLIVALVTSRALTLITALAFVMAFISGAALLLDMALPLVMTNLFRPTYSFLIAFSFRVANLFLITFGNYAALPLVATDLFIVTLLFGLISSFAFRLGAIWHLARASVLIGNINPFLFHHIFLKSPGVLYLGTIKVDVESVRSKRSKIKRSVRCRTFAHIYSHVFSFSPAGR